MTIPTGTIPIKPVLDAIRALESAQSFLIQMHDSYSLAHATECAITANALSKALCAAFEVVQVRQEPLNQRPWPEGGIGP